MIDTELVYTPGYCLNAMEKVTFISRKNVMTDHLHCQFCGPVTDRYNTDTWGLHIIEPNEKLITILEEYKVLKNVTIS